MKPSFVVLAEYSDDLEAQVVRAMLYDADIETEVEQERARGMLHPREDMPIRVMVSDGDLERARKLIRAGLSPYRSNGSEQQRFAD